MHAYTPTRLNDHGTSGSIGRDRDTTAGAQPRNYCQRCDRLVTAERYGLTDAANNAFVEERCPDCRSVLNESAHARGQLVTDGGVDVQSSSSADATTPAPATILADYAEIDEHARRVRAFALGHVHETDLSLQDVEIALRLTQGEICLRVEHRAGTEDIRTTEDGWESIFDSDEFGLLPDSDWLRSEDVARRLTRPEKDVSVIASADSRFSETTSDEKSTEGESR